MPMPSHPRSNIYYWKCDRPAAFHGTEARTGERADVAAALAGALAAAFPGSRIALRSGGGQGNHLTFVADIDGVERFVRVDDGPERDDYLDVESHVLGAVRAVGLPAPRVLAVDASRQTVPFAWHVMERVDRPDLNQLWKQGTLNLPKIAAQIGAAVARWQAIDVAGFGPFDPAVLGAERRLQGFHAAYTEYFHLSLERHLGFLVERQFLDAATAAAMRAEIRGHEALLALPKGCLVHKDLALWNILGTNDTIDAWIDWDDTISGDPLDDLSLLGCFHDGAFLTQVVAGYEGVRPLPGDWRRRFWIHLLRNLIMKSVIRVGAGYFDRTDGFFLIDSGSTGTSLRQFTLDRLAAALKGLREDADLGELRDA